MEPRLDRISAHGHSNRNNMDLRWLQIETNTKSFIIFVGILLAKD